MCKYTNFLFNSRKLRMFCSQKKAITFLYS